MKVVAISQRMDLILDRNEIRDALDQRLMIFIADCGFMPVPVPNALGERIHQWLMVFKPEAIILSGGNEIGQFSERDSTETALLAYARENNFPALGICRGMQMMANLAGATLHRVYGHIKMRHRLIGQISVEVNSYHQYSLSQCPRGYEVLACSTDGEIEAIRHLTLPWEGWMWHPEREEYFQSDDALRIKALFSG